MGFEAGRGRRVRLFQATLLGSSLLYFFSLTSSLPRMKKLNTPAKFALTKTTITRFTTQRPASFLGTSVVVTSSIF